MLVGSELITVLHKLEQASSDQHIGTQAENLLEALSGNDKVAEKVSSLKMSIMGFTCFNYNEIKIIFFC